MQQIIKRYLPPRMARNIKQIAVYPRYLRQAVQCRRGYVEFADRYPQPILFVAGLPKSGTTWLEQMLADYPGFHTIMPPAAVAYELRTGGSHDYELPTDYFFRLRGMLAVNKMHVHGSPQNAQRLREANIHYVIIYRDLRDVAVSYYFYVRRTPWHPDYPIYKNLSPEDGLKCFADQLLLPYVAWVKSWHQHRDPRLSLMIRYEEMVKNPVGVMTNVTRHFGLDHCIETVQTVVNAHDFTELSRGRQPGEQQVDSFFRKGIVGDWKYYFTPTVADLYKQHIGSFLIDYGYESDNTW